MTVIPPLVLAAIAACSAWSLGGWIATLRVIRQRRPVLPPSDAVPVSVLKPLCGADAGLEDNLESWFRQSYPAFELVFGAGSAGDPGFGVARRVAARFPKVPVRFVVSEDGLGLNPKVNNLRSMLPHATHDLVLVSDSSIRAPAHCLAELVAVKQREGAGLVMSLFANDDRSLGAALDSVQSSGFCTAGVTLPTLFGEAAVIGKNTLFSRTEFAAQGGIERLSHVLAEDFVLGKIFQHAGQKVVIAPTVVENVTGKLSIRGFMQRHLRWSMLRWRLKPAAAALEPLARPLALLPLAWHWLGVWSLVWAVAVWIIRDVGGQWLLRGPKRAWMALLLSPLCDLMMLAVWALAPLKKHVTWRGTRLRLGAGTLLYREVRSAR